MRHAFYSLITPHLHPDQAIEEAVRLGFQGIEWRIAAPSEPIASPRTYWEGNRCSLHPADLAKELPPLANRVRAAGLVPLSICPYATTAEPEVIEGFLQTAATSGVDLVRVCVPRYDPQTSYTAQFDALRRQVAVIETLARKAGVRACLLQHSGTLLPSASACARALEGVDPQHLGLFLDVGHFVREGYEDFGIVIDLVADYLAEIHLRNGWVRPTATEPGLACATPDAEWGRLDAGQVPLGLLAEALARRAWDGWLVLEDFSDRPQALRLQEGLETMRRLSHLATPTNA